MYVTVPPASLYEYATSRIFVLVPIPGIMYRYPNHTASYGCGVRAVGSVRASYWAGSSAARIVGSAAHVVTKARDPSARFLP